MFIMQASSPTVSNTWDLNDKTISDAMQTIFPLMTENAFMVWNHNYIPLSYKNDLSIMVDDIILMVTNIHEKTGGAMTIDWPSNTFSSLWEISWDSETVSVLAQWNSVIGGIEGLLSINPRICLSRNDFLAEWKMLLDVIAKSLLRAGYSKSDLNRFEELLTIIERISQYGVLYR